MPPQGQSNVVNATQAMSREEASEMADQAVENERWEARRHNEELRRPLYRDVESLINPGFISEPFEMGAVVWSIRSLSPGDLHRIRNAIHLDASTREWKEWCLAVSVWMIDGYIVLDQPNVARMIKKSLERLPKNALDILWSLLHGLFNRVSQAIPKVEPYCYEMHSRALWRFCGRETPSREEFTGIPGSGKLGMNLIQRMWLSYNLSEDEREQELRSWNAAKLIASSNSPKGIKKLNASDEQRYKAEDLRRQRVMDQLYFEHIGWKTADEHENRVFQPHSADELVEQMRRWNEGELDFHDIVVKNWKVKIKELEQQKRDEMKARAEARRKAQEEAAESGDPDNSLVGYSQDELHQMIRGKGFRRTRRVVDGSAFREKYNKYLDDHDTGYLAPHGVVSDPDQGSTLKKDLTGRVPTMRTNIPDYVPTSAREKFAQDLGTPRGVSPILNDDGEGED